MAEHEEPSSGVRSLIERVRTEGAEAGASEAKRIVEEAHQKAAKILEDARAEAERFQAEARERVQVERESGRAALEQAARDTILSLQEELTTHFGRQVERLVEQRLRDPEVVERLIIELVGAERPSPDEDARVLLPRQAFDLEDLRERNTELGEDPVDAFVLSVARTRLREGATIGAVDGEGPGFTIRLRDDEVEIDVTTRAVTELLERHLLPRFRGLLEGVFR